MFVKQKLQMHESLEFFFFAHNLVLATDLAVAIFFPSSFLRVSAYFNACCYVSSLHQSFRFFKEMRKKKLIKKIGVAGKKMRREDRGWPYIIMDVHYLVVITEQQVGVFFPSLCPSIALLQFIPWNTLTIAFFLLQPFKLLCKSYMVVLSKIHLFVSLIGSGGLIDARKVWEGSKEGLFV